MARSQSSMADEGPKERSTHNERNAPPTERATSVFAHGLIRLGLAIFGTVLLLFALGQAFGLDLVGAVAEFLITDTGQWIAVAFVALLLISIAAGGWRYRRPPA
jgi:hypothetical protein